MGGNVLSDDEIRRLVRDAGPLDGAEVAPLKKTAAEIRALVEQELAALDARIARRQTLARQRHWQRRR